jgi:Ribbon-helix-helix protein, copG family.
VRERKADTLAELGRKGREVMERLEPRGTRAEGGKSEGLELTKVTIRLPLDLVKTFKHMAIDEGRTFQELVAEAMREYLKRR